ncbi:YebC/PmpR family DNA-binding transcriptional regulator [Candidatus Roizmanbacteria bacterium]|nr:YebC/PmpR family DNA-binding transcriptional regulator [Candidatus Roizmanbacteria bacterium]
MSGHSKWSKIKRQKEATDKQKGTTFSKLSRLISLAVIEGGGITDPDNNVRLRFAIEKAKRSNMSKDNIDRAIQNGVAPGKNQLKETVYEVFAPSGVAMVILTTTDNANRTLSEIRNVVELHGGKLGNQGSVLYLFKKCGLAIFKTLEVTEESIFSFADKIGAFDMDKNEDYYYVYFPYEFLGKVKEYLNELDPMSVETDFKPQTLIKVEDKKKLEKISALVEALEDLDDVQKVFTNI